MCRARPTGRLAAMTAFSRRKLLSGTAAAATAVAGLSLLDGCSTEEPPVLPAGSPSPQTESPPPQSAPPGTAIANIRVNDGKYGVHVEPSVAANPRNPRQLLAACQVSPTADPEFIATYMSLDAGATWHSGGVPKLPAASGRTGDDVTVAFDSNGRGHVCATSYGGGRAVYAWRTDDGGRTYSDPITLVADRYCDHPWLVTGPQRTVFAAWASGNKTGLAFTRSTDGGESFEAPRTILADEAGAPAMSAGAILAAAPNGVVCVVCDRETRGDPSIGFASQVVAVCSTDGGRTFSSPVRLGEEASVIALPGDVMPNSGPAVAAAPDGTLYVAFARHQAGAAHSDIAITASHDSGRTWTQPASATPADGVIYFQPNLSVDASGRVAISAFALSNGRIDVVLLVSQPGQLRFAAPHRVTTTAFDPAHSQTTAGKHGAWWVGDYQGLAGSNGAFHLLWNDTRTGKHELYAASVPVV
jgi:hypothetical protein